MINEWQQILERLEPNVSHDGYVNWLQPIQFSHIDDARTLHLKAPNLSAIRWLETEYQDSILSTARNLSLGVESVVFLVNSPSPLSSGRPPEQTRFDFSQQAWSFNPKYSFDAFVVGSCNEFAHAGAQAVANNPARAYNPLYIYGGVGMGKTHLMHAIGQQLRTNFPDLQVVYVSGEEFMNEMISSLRYDHMGSFRERFRCADALLVDDIQILEKKERTQEEFFHTFNALYNLQKQIVISSDRPPKQIPGIVDRLRSRFEWGLMVDIQTPDLETKMAILDRKAEEFKIDLPHKVRIHMATQLTSNVRELEGALTRLMAVASLTGEEITLSMAKQTLRSMVSTQESKPTINGIVRLVAEEFGIEASELRGKSNARAISFPRQVAMYLIRELIGSSYPEIGRAFRGKHHTTVIHAVNKIERLCQNDDDINNLVHKLTDRIN